jgi:hypothetical protein
MLHIHACCNMFQVFQMFQTYVASVLSRCRIYFFLLREGYEILEQYITKLHMKKSKIKRYIIFYIDSSIIFFPNGFSRIPKLKCSPYAEKRPPQDIGHAARFNALEPVQNASKSLKEYRQLHRHVWHRMQIPHLDTSNSSLRPSTMRSMARSRFPCRGP